MDVFFASLARLPFWLLITLSASSVIIGDYLAKYWSVSRGGWVIPLALVAYVFSGFFYIPTLLKEGLVITSLVWSLLNIIGFIVIGLVFFKESLTQGQVAGVAIGVIALLVLAVSG